MLLWGGQSLSELGSQISLVAYPLLVLALTGSPAKAGIVGFAKTIPLPLLALPAGSIADRVNRKHLMLACDGVRAIALTGLAIWLLAGRVPFGLIVVVAFIDGAGFIFSYIAERGALRRLVPREHLPEAVARNESRTFAAMLAGPPLGGLLFGLGRPVPFVTDAISYTASTAAMLLMRTDFQEAREDGAHGGLADGVRWLWARPFMRACMLIFSAGNLVFTGLYLFVVVVAKAHGASSLLVGIMLAIAAALGLLGTLLAPVLGRRLGPRGAVICEELLIALMLPLLLLTHSPIVLGLIVGGAEFMTPTVNAIVVGYRVAHAPDRLQGRIQAASTLFSYGGGALGPLVVGVLVQSAGATTTILAMVAVTTLLAVAALTTPALRRFPALEAS
jgi:MFS family permease